MTVKPPEAYIQWKGTDVCMDVFCPCGAEAHFHGYFAYAVRCCSCNAVWALPNTLPLTPGPQANEIVQDLEPPKGALEESQDAEERRHG